MDSETLNGISLSGIINQFINIPHQEQEQTNPEQTSLVYQISSPAMMQQQQYNNISYNIMQQPADAPEQLKPRIRILEQPKSNSLRFRYQCEGRGAGALQGQSSTQDRKTYPKIQIMGTRRKVVVVVSCVTHDTDLPRAHPHNLVSPASVGKDGCKRGVCTLHVSSEDMTIEFQHLGIQCVRKKDIEESLRQRKDIRVDPFKQGFKHLENPSSIDLNAVKLCFQAFLEDPNKPGKFTEALDPVCSTNIFDAKARKCLEIMDISDVTAPPEGGKKILLFCEKVSREDIKVRFSDGLGWEGWADFNPAEVHKQYGVAFKTPKYRDGNLKDMVKVFLELYKPSDESVSEPMDFFFVPQERILSPRQLAQGASQVKSGFPAINGGGARNGSMEVKDFKDLRIKQEMADQQNWSQTRVSRGYNGYVSSSAQSGPALNIQQGSNNFHNNYNNIQQQQQQQQHGGFVNNMTRMQHPAQQNYPVMPDMPALVSPYSHQQPSPDSQGFADMRLASPQHRPEEDPPVVDEADIENVSGKLESFSLSDAIETSLYMQGMTAPAASESRRGKRSQQTAALESGSNVVPREMSRLHSGQLGAGLLDTPNCSGQMAGPDSFLQNCRQVNDL